ncbi:MAG: protein kinase [Xanthomonadales bacterium]|nr:protein kinase [Xanthomonadales bacterium]
MTPTAERNGLSLGARLFLAFGLVLALAVGGAMVVTLQVVRDIAADTVETSLANSQSVQRYFRQFRARQLELITELVSADPYFGSYVDEAVNADDPELAARSVADLLQSRRNEFGIDIAMVLDPAGKVVARTDRPQALAVDLSENPLVARGLDELGPVSGLWSSGDRLYQASVTPIARGRTVAGFMVAGLALDNSLANDVKRVSGADVAYLTAGDRTRVVATTLDVPATDRLLAKISADGELGRALLETSESGRTLRIELGNDRWLAQLSPLLDARGEAFGTTVAMTSLDRELAAYQNIPIVVLITGVVAIVVALVLSYAISQRILQPVRRLTSAAEAAMDGNYRHQVATEGSDEIGRLSRAFDSLLSSLREKRDMEDYMADMARHAPLDDHRERDSARVEHAEGHATEPMANATQPDSPSGKLRRHLGERYELLAELGRGAMGVVFKAYDKKLDEIVAIKMIKPGSVDTQSLERLKSELKLARRITHPNVLRTYDFGEAGEAPYLSMEFVSGMTLRELLDRRGKLPYGAALRIARQLCAGLEAVHEVGVLHRDIKPGNVMLEHRGNAKLMDFGISRPAKSDEDTSGDQLSGTPHYMAPEQIQGSHLDVRTDIYSLGVVLEELFTGGMPFSGETGMEIAVARLHRSPVPPSHFWSSIPEELETIILRCLAFKPEDRYQDTAALAMALGKLRG